MLKTVQYTLGFDERGIFQNKLHVKFYSTNLKFTTECLKYPSYRLDEIHFAGKNQNTKFTYFIQNILDSIFIFSKNLNTNFCFKTYVTLFSSS